MEQYVIVSNNDTGELSIQLRQFYKLEDFVFQYEPIESCDTLEEALRLKQHIEAIGVQAYFDEIVAKA
jgi:hypothetical protein